MQRAAVTNDASESTLDQPSSKRRKVAGLQSGSSTDLQMIRAAMASEELKRAEAMERQAERAGETRWFLSFQDESQGTLATGASTTAKGLQVIQTGFASIDEVPSRTGDKEVKADYPRQARGVGRMNFGNFSHASEVGNN